MGEIADMMLDGTLCEGCGVYIGEGDGFPQYCSKDCADDRGYSEQENSLTKKERSRKKAKSKRKRKNNRYKKMMEQHSITIMLVEEIMDANDKYELLEDLASHCKEIKKTIDEVD